MNTKKSKFRENIITKLVRIADLAYLHFLWLESPYQREALFQPM